MDKKYKQTGKSPLDEQFFVYDSYFDESLKEI